MAKNIDFNDDLYEINFTGPPGHPLHPRHLQGRPAGQPAPGGEVAAEDPPRLQERHVHLAGEPHTVHLIIHLNIHLK